MLWRFFLILLCFFSPLTARRGAVAYEYNPQEDGRFGDNLLNYLHAKWFSLEKKVPLLYTPFPLSDQLILSDKEPRFKDQLLTAPVRYWSFLSKIPLLNFCYISPYFPEDPWELKREKFHTYRVDWKNERFRKIAKEMIAPKKPLNLIQPPEGSLSVALHVRDGGGFDSLHAKRHFPLKFPPLSFYSEGLKTVLALFPERPIYCYLFTDAKEPDKIAAQLLSTLPPETPIQFDFRKDGAAPVLEDFFSLFQFDVLIRSQSNFSMVPSLIHDFALVYAPKEGFANETGIHITEVEITLTPKVPQ